MTIARTHVRCCAICGSKKDLHDHHLGLRKHAAFFTIPLCTAHHEAVHVALTRAGVDPTFTTVAADRARQARMAALIFLWFLEEQLKATEQIDLKSKGDNR